MAETWRQPPREVVPGTRGRAFARITGQKRHVTVYPLLRNKSEKATITLEKDSTLPEVEVLLKGNHWTPGEWTALEPGVYVTPVIRDEGITQTESRS
jgi:hypothetical protein